MYKSKLYTILGFCIIIFFGYRILILERIPYKINETIGLYMRLFVILFLIFQIFVFYKTLKEIIKPSYEYNGKLHEIINTLYYKPLTNVGEMLLKRIGFQKYIKNCAGTLWYTVKEPYHVYLIIFLMLITPKIIVSTTLILDIILLNKVKVFYEISWIIAIPYIFNGTLACVNMYILKLRDMLPLKTVKESKSHIRINATKIEMTKKDFEYNVQVWSYYSEILDCVHALKLVQKKQIILCCNLICTTLFIIGWLSYLYLVCEKPTYYVITNPFILNILTWLLKILRTP